MKATEGQSEARIQAEIRQAVNASGRARLVRNSIGYDPASRITYGLGVGSPDLVGVLTDGTARAFLLEIKTPTGALSIDQCAWWAQALGWSVLGGIPRSVPNAMRLLDLTERGDHRACAVAILAEIRGELPRIQAEAGRAWQRGVAGADETLARAARIATLVEAHMEGIR
jgi:hypothetical protein